MKLLLVITEQDIDPSAPVIDTSAFKKRSAARGVMIKHNGSVCLLKVGAHNYHKLPGGGVDEGEDIKAAFHRELLEETGCQAEILGEVGKIVECRNQFELIQTSYCFLAKQVGQQMEAALEEGEIEEDIHEIATKDIDDAIRLFEEDTPNNYQGRFIVRRDLKLLQTARELL
jgi:8-oxo-dGTP diphosphatase